MLMRSRHPDPVPAEALFPSWRGRLPFEPRLEDCEAQLHALRPGLRAAIADLPFERFEAADRISDIVASYHLVPPEALALVERLPDQLRAPWLAALLLWHMERFEQRFAQSRLAPEFALHYADHFNRILDQIEQDPGFADLGSDSFRKDLWLARVVMIPAFALVWWPHAGLSAGDVLRAGPSAVANLLVRCGGRRPFLEGHTHDPVAKAYWNEAGWGEALRLAALALPAFPRARGICGTAWFYDPAILEITPRLSFAQQLQIGKGAFRIRIGSNEAAVRNSTATSADRRARYEAGSYVPTDYAIIWPRKALTAAYGAGSE
jgi:hypothetical protein